MNSRQFLYTLNATVLLQKLTPCAEIQVNLNLHNKIIHILFFPLQSKYTDEFNKILIHDLTRRWRM